MNSLLIHFIPYLFWLVRKLVLMSGKTPFFLGFHPQAEMGHWWSGVVFLFLTLQCPPPHHYQCSRGPRLASSSASVPRCPGDSWPSSEIPDDESGGSDAMMSDWLTCACDRAPPCDYTMTTENENAQSDCPFCRPLLRFCRMTVACPFCVYDRLSCRTNRCVCGSNDDRLLGACVSECHFYFFGHWGF